MTLDRRELRLAALRLLGPALTASGQLARRVGTAPASDDSSQRLRVLLIRPDHLGDVLLATPAAAILRTALPAAQVDWLVGPWSAEIARLAGGRAEIRTVEFPGFTRQPRSSAVEPYTLLLQEAARLRARRYDAALILRPDHWWGAMLAAAAGIPRRFGFSVQECLPFLTDTLPPPDRHVVQANQQLAQLAARRLGDGDRADRTVLAPHLPVSAEDAAWVANHVPPMGSDSAPLVAIHPGTGAAVKTWLPERWAEVVRTLSESRQLRLILTGGPGEHALIGQIVAQLDAPPEKLVGATTVGQLAALFARCDLVIGGDSGPLHLAAAVNTPTVRLYGPTDIQEFGPWPPEGLHVALAAGLSCQPCRDLVAPPCGARQTPPCLRAMNADGIVSVANQLLDAAQPRAADAALAERP